MSVTPFMRFYPGDWKQKTSHLKAEARGVYLELILHIFSNGSLPDDDEALARIAGVTIREFRRIRPSIEPFFIMPGWRQVRAEEEREHARERSKKAVESANARWREKNYEKIEEKIEKNSQLANATANQQIGETFEETAKALCERIADAYPNAMLSESESESDRKKDTTQHTRARFDEIENRLRDAAGLQSAPSPGLFVIGPIIACIDGGCDLELDVLPTVRARTHNRVTSWKFFVEAIWEAKAAREAAGQTRAVAAPTANCQAPMPKDWRPSAEDVDYGKKLGLSQGDLDWTAESLRNWAPGKQREDWSAVFRSFALRKAERDGKSPPSPNRMIEPHQDPMAKAMDFYARRAAQRDEEKAG